MRIANKEYWTLRTSWEGYRGTKFKVSFIRRALNSEDMTSLHQEPAKAHVTDVCSDSTIRDEVRQYLIFGLKMLFLNSVTMGWQEFVEGGDGAIGGGGVGFGCSGTCIGRGWNGSRQYCWEIYYNIFFIIVQKQCNRSCRNC